VFALLSAGCGFKLMAHRRSRSPEDPVEVAGDGDGADPVPDVVIEDGHLRLQVGQKDDDELDICGICRDPHPGVDPDQWWGCQKCAQWYYLPCLGFSPKKIAELKAKPVWECNLDEYCASLPSGVRSAQAEKNAARAQHQKK
jgi:TPP-dependent indolepyruvate ferredoxin oxidoreductase alpha subunit